MHLHGKHKKIIAIANNYQFHCYLRLFKRTMVNQKDFNLIGNNWWHISLQIRKALFSLTELGRFNAAQNKHAFFSSGAFVYTVSPTKLKINQFSYFWSFKFFYFLFLAGHADNFFALRVNQISIFVRTASQWRSEIRGLSLMKWLNPEKLTSFKIHELSFTSLIFTQSSREKDWLVFTTLAKNSRN